MDLKGSIKIAIICDNASTINKTILPILKKLPINYNIIPFDTLAAQPIDICFTDYVYLLIQISAENDYKKIKQHININSNIPPVCFLFEDYSIVNKNFIYSFNDSDYLVYPLHEKEIQSKLIKSITDRAESSSTGSPGLSVIDIQSMDWFDFFTSFTFDGILIHDKGVIIDINDSLIKISGYSRNELIGKNIIELAVCENFRHIVYQNMKKEVLTPYEIQIRIKNGEKHWVKLQGRKFELGKKT